MVDCPMCSLEFDSERNMKIHHNMTHGISLTEFHADREWVQNEMTEEDIDEVSIDRMMKHLTQTIRMQQEKYDLQKRL